MREPTEIWKMVTEFPSYEVSSLGRVRRGQQLLTPTAFLGYLVVTPCLGGKKYCRRVNRLVCEAFNGPAPSDEHQAAHWDGNKNNNISSNLRWATALENAADRDRHLMTAKGSKNAAAVLSENDVHHIRGLLKAGLTKTTIGRFFGVSRPEKVISCHGSLNRCHPLNR